MKFRRTVLTIFFILLVASVFVVITVTPQALQLSGNNSTSVANPGNSSLTDAEQALKEKLDNYSKRADDLQKLVSLLLGLSTIYAIALAFSAYTSVQSNLKQAEKSIDKLESLLQQLPKDLEEIQNKTSYSTKIAMASGSLALALQAKYLADAEIAIHHLLDLRNGTYSTDRFVNLLIGRLYKALNRLQNAQEAMTSFINRKEKMGEPDDSAIADAYYNRACYQSLRWVAARDEEKQNLIAGIKEDLARTFRLDETYQRDVGSDEDFKNVKDEEWFKSLLSG